MPIHPIIEMDELKNQLSDESLRIIDCRFSLQDVTWGFHSYELSHIIGATYADLNKNLSSKIGSKTGRHPLPFENDFVAFIQESGISNHSHVVAYDEASGSMAASRLWWLLRAYGMQNVQVLNGSFSDWVAMGYPVASQKTHYSHGSFKGKLNPDWIVDAAAVNKARIDSDKILIDARSHDRFIGQNEVIDNVAGHIPGAVNRPVLDNLAANKKLKPAFELKADFLALIGDINPENVILYCGSGATACFNHLAMEIARLHGAKIYPGSWSEWITDPSHKIATGE
ncbi:MAG TPA: sulfurtransferase [Leptolinea sp.]